jgi:hypothetical protein
VNRRGVFELEAPASSKTFSESLKSARPETDLSSWLASSTASSCASLSALWVARVWRKRLRQALTLCLVPPGAQSPFLLCCAVIKFKDER